MALREYDWRRRVLLLLLASELYALFIVFMEPSPLMSGDFQALHLPNRELLRKAVLNLEWPLWNPYVAAGRPFAADIECGVFYPTSYLHLFLPTHIAVSQEIAIHVFFFGWFALRLCDAFGVSQGLSFLALAIFVFSPCATGRLMLGQIHYFMGLCYAPALLYFVWHTPKVLSFTWLLGSALLWCGSFLSGHPQVFWLENLMVIAFAFCGNFACSVASFRQTLCVWAHYVLGLTLGLGLAAPLGLSFGRFLVEGHRGVSPEQGYAQNLDLYAIVESFFVYPAKEDIWRVDQNAFVGPFILLGAMLSMLWFKEKYVRAFWGVFVMGLILVALGNFADALVINKFVPGYSAFRLHSRALALCVLSLVFLAPLGFAALAGRREWQGGRCAAVLVCVALLQLVWTGNRLKNDYKQSSLSVREEQMKDFVKQEQRRTKETAAPLRLSWFKHADVLPNAGIRYGYSSMNGFAGVHLQRYYQFVQHYLQTPLHAQHFNFVVTTAFSGPIFPLRTMALELGFDRENQVFVSAENPGARAFLVYDYRLETQMETIARLMRQGFPFESVALVEKPIPEMSLGDARPSEYDVEIQSFNLNEVLVRVNTQKPGLLVLSETWHPNWKVDLLGHTSSTLPVNGWMRGAVVPAGDHLVRFFYDPVEMRQGAILSPLLLALLLMGVWSRQKKERVV
jgi:hypothetical protein